MEQALKLTTFDERARQRVRDGLRSYMRTHRIGVPTLQVRIIEADAPRYREIPLSTLQRFLRDAHRTADAHVAVCAQFLEKAGEPIAAADDTGFAPALAGFIGVPDDPLSVADAALQSELAGDYEVTGRQEGEPAIRLGLMPAPGRPWLDAAETVSPSEDSPLRHRYEGTLAGNGPLLFIALRHTLTRLPKIYWLERADSAGKERYLAGQMAETLFRAEGEKSSRVFTRQLILEAKG
ncbi:MAG TPA: hypothetical protein PKA33_17840 [Amaricoccus sp.]|uniref:hypothetical protein n=1 Tax=Amaricoccus sp. TaxID=1872485 RepID=UPI002CCD5991|nr:hypothetical protein [Amaricoccus sp.]HMQ92841.1 hypothetical protein [Amaricoccus sp.]HMR37055.1 hypothetical protein [Paracoccus sp. (in: a-proteobacteria)]HMR54161.1 hypothetical protein [Amaricoccus sp.]HMU01210.1 hypothetical protein [Amaricoccus sp.]